MSFLQRKSKNSIWKSFVDSFVFWENQISEICEIYYIIQFSHLIRWYSILHDIRHEYYLNRNENYWPTSRYFLDVDALDDEIHFVAATRVYKDRHDIRGHLVSLVTSDAIWNVNMQNIFQAAPNTIKILNDLFE